jgi:hypothetical protein
MRFLTSILFFLEPIILEKNRGLDREIVEMEHNIDLPSPAFSGSEHNAFGSYSGNTPNARARLPSYAQTPSGAEDRHGGPPSVSSSAMPVPHKFAAPMTPSGSGHPETPRAPASNSAYRSQHSVGPASAMPLSLNPMTPQTPATVESGIVPQLQ